jgi:hypothetical protein
MTMRHIMVDLETLGTTNDAVFLSIGAVEFNLNGEIGSTFYENITVDSAQKVGLKINGDTLKWWMTQKPEIMQRMFKDAKELTTVLNNYSDWVRQTGAKYFWGNSASFDLGMLGNGYRATNKKAPWDFWQEMCYRTLLNLYPGCKGKPPENAHDPVADCKFQIQNLAAVAQKLKLTDKEAK